MGQCGTRTATGALKKGGRVHNSYMLASAWRIVGSVLEIIADELGGHDDTVKDRLKQDVAFRALYLELWDHVGKLVDAAQNKFALLATTARKLLRTHRTGASLILL